MFFYTYSCLNFLWLRQRVRYAPFLNVLTFLHLSLAHTLLADSLANPYVASELAASPAPPACRLVSNEFILCATYANLMVSCSCLCFSFRGLAPRQLVAIAVPTSTTSTTSTTTNTSPRRGSSGFPASRLRALRAKAGVFPGGRTSLCFSGGPREMRLLCLGWACLQEGKNYITIASIQQANSAFRFRRP
jgi:hypothetical protein